MRRSFEVVGLKELSKTREGDLPQSEESVSDTAPHPLNDI